MLIKWFAFNYISKFIIVIKSKVRLKATKKLLSYRYNESFLWIL